MYNIVRHLHENHSSVRLEDEGQLTAAWELMGKALSRQSEPATRILLGMDREEVRDLCGGLGMKPFQEKDVYTWMYCRRQLDPDGWTSIPKEARARLAARAEAGLPELDDVLSSADGTSKALLRLADGERIETVHIPEGGRHTLCVSSQVGCALGCAFCLTAQLGFRRNLTAGEILGQLYRMEETFDLEHGRYNVVFMGMGEPLANIENLKRAYEIMVDTEGLALSRHRITVSTAGLHDAMVEVAGWRQAPRLSLSLNAADDELRARLMPVAGRTKLADLRDALLKIKDLSRTRTSIEYVLLKGVNDGSDDAKRLAAFLNGLRVKVNLIPFNGAESLPYEPSGEIATLSFQERLFRAGIQTNIRKSRGGDILAACGQLAREGWSPMGSCT